MNIESFGISHVGLVRSNNEDVWMALPEKQFFILADGMGGHNAGEVAALLSATSLCQSMKTLPDSISVRDACQLLRQAIVKANTLVFEESHHRPEWKGMGTTLSCFIIVDSFLVYAHVGDSRLYRYRDELTQLTEDHSLRVNAKPKEAPPRNVITRAIGAHTSILPDVGIIPLVSKDIYMLCSDGLSDCVSKQTLSRLLASSFSLEEIGKKLVETALEKGGNDNISLLLGRVV